jgi:hypothetical protein
MYLEAGNEERRVNKIKRIMYTQIMNHPLKSMVLQLTGSRPVSFLMWQGRWWIFWKAGVWIRLFINSKNGNTIMTIED